MPPVSIVSVWQPARIASGTAARSVTAQEVGAEDPRPGELAGDQQDHEQDEQRDDRPVPEQALPAGQRQPLAPRRHAAGRLAHPRCRRSWTRLPTMTTPMRIDALDDDGEVGVEPQERHVGPDQLEDRDRDERPDDAAPAAGEADPAEDDRRDAQQRVRPGHRRPDAGARGQRRGRRARRTARAARRRGPSSGRPTRRSGTPPAGRCRRRRSGGPPSSAGAGSRSRR